MCKISIIMPVYNKEKYVQKAIDSVIAQTFTDWELIMIDDGSTDLSFEICRQYKDERIHLIRVENGGVSRARNIGLKNAKGEYITFLDSDDYIDEKYLEKLIIDDAPVVISGLTGRNVKGEKLESVLPMREGKVLIKEVYRRFYQEQIESGIYGFIAGKTVKSSILRQNDIWFNESYKLAEDYDFFIRVYQNIDAIFFVKESYYNYLHENEEAFDIKKEDIPSQIEIQLKVKKFLKDNTVFSAMDEKVMNEKLTQLIYTYLISCDMRKLRNFREDLAKLCLYKIEDYCKLNSRYSNLIIDLYKKNREILLYAMLSLRKLKKEKD